MNQTQADEAKALELSDDIRNALMNLARLHPDIGERGQLQLDIIDAIGCVTCDLRTKLADARAKLADAVRILGVYATPESYHQEREANSNVYRSWIGDDNGACARAVLTTIATRQPTQDKGDE